MYLQYFGFVEPPFSIAPNPRYLYMSERHREALAHLLYGVKGEGGFVLLTGEVGTGKTTICRCLLEQTPADCDVAFIFNPKLDARELLSAICDELRIARGSDNASIKTLVVLINRRLLESNARGRRTLLIIDEAQNLDADVLEQLRLLTNLETNERKLLQVILIGQPELRARLAKPELRQLAQRVLARYHLEPLSRVELGAYVSHRLAVAGVRRPLFRPNALDCVYRLSRGTPRVINTICDRALLGAWTQGKEAVDRRTVENAAAEVLGRPASGLSRWQATAAAAIGLLLIGAVLAVGYPSLRADRGAATADRVAAVEPAAPLPASPPPPPVLPPEPTAEERIAWPAGADRWLHEVLAVRSLFGLWNADVEPGEFSVVCPAAARRGLRCLSAAGGSIERLRQMNVPAVLWLSATSEPDYAATLTSLGKDVATLVIAGEQRSVPLDLLKSRWSGKYVLLWRGPPGDPRLLASGADGAQIAWLEQQLDTALGASTKRSGVFDEGLQRRVRAFQLAAGLDPDGIPGSVTLVRLAGAVDPKTPALTAREAD